MKNRVLISYRGIISWAEDWSYISPLSGEYVVSKSIKYSFTISEHWSKHTLLSVVKICGKKDKENKKYLDIWSGAFPLREDLGKLGNQNAVRYEAKKILFKELNLELPEIELCGVCDSEPIKPEEGELTCKKCIESNKLYKSGEK